MPEPKLTAEQIAEAKRLLDAITPGPWQAHSRHVKNVQNDPAFGEQSGLGWDIIGPPEPQLRGQFSSGYDATFIATAPDLVRRALAELEALRAKNRQLRYTMQEALRQIHNLCHNQLETAEGKAGKE